MNALSLLRFALRLPRQAAPAPRRSRPPAGLPARRFSRRALLCGAGVFAASWAGASVGFDHFAQAVRDPEFGRKLARLKARTAANPTRPVVVVLGSSRVAFGLRAAAWEAERPGRPDDPVVFNLALMGSGPVMQVMALRRLAAAGVRPAAVVAEYWPPFLRQDGGYAEEGRIVPTRLGPEDRGFIRDYFTDPAGAEGAMRRAAWNPVHVRRTVLMAQLAPSWLPVEKRVDSGWAGMDAFGWVPGADDPPGDTSRRTLRLEGVRKLYQDQFAGYRIAPVSDRALRELAALAREAGAAFALAWLPESTEFRGWYTPAAEATAAAHLAGLRAELNAPLIDARGWMPDDRLADGFHLTQHGAAEFGARFGREMAGTFPQRSRP